MIAKPPYLATAAATADCEPTDTARAATTRTRSRRASLATACALALTLVACGGGSSSSTNAASTEAIATLKLGGTVSGLGDRQTLRLQNQDDVLTVTQNGAFEFSTLLVKGSNYSVSVAGQPSWQGCQVDAASGTASADVTTVTVHCEDLVPQVTTLMGDEAGLTLLRGIALAPDGSAYLTSEGRIYKVTTAGAVSLLAGGDPGYQDGPATTAQFNSASGIDIDRDGIAFVGDARNNVIRRITPSGDVSTLAGSGTLGSTDGNGTQASFYSPFGVTVDSDGTLYVVDYGNRRIRKISPAGDVSTIWTGTVRPYRVAVSPDGFVYFTAADENQIYRITPQGEAAVFAGSGVAGFADGTGTAALLNRPIGIQVDAAGILYVADQTSNRIRRITPAGEVTTLVGTGQAGGTDGDRTVATFNRPMDLTVAADGTLLVLDNTNTHIRKITPVRPQP